MNYSSGFGFLGLTPLFSGPVASIDKQYRHGRRCTWRPSSATLLRWIFTYFSLLPSLSAHRLVYFPQLSTLTTSSGHTKITIKTNGRIINASGTLCSSWRCLTLTHQRHLVAGFFLARPLCYFGSLFWPRWKETCWWRAQNTLSWTLARSKASRFDLSSGCWLRAIYRLPNASLKLNFAASSPLSTLIMAVLIWNEIFDRQQHSVHLDALKKSAQTSSSWIQLFVDGKLE